MKEVEVFIDTNIFLRFFTADQQQPFQECKKLFEKIRTGSLKAYTSTLVLSELLWTLKGFYKCSKEETVVCLESVAKMHKLRVTEDSNLSLGITLFKNTPVKWIDALIASNRKIQSRELIVLSYDKDFDRLGVKRLEPKDFF